MSSRFASLPATALAAALSLAAIGAAPATAAAQDAGPAAPRAFTGVVGAGVVVLPRYTGSDEYRVLPMPVVQLEYKGRLYVGGSQGSVSPGVGAILLRTSAFRWDVGVSGAEQRPESRGDALAGMGKRSAAGFVATGVSYRLGVVMASAAGSFGLGDEPGSHGTLGLGTELPLSRRWVAGVSTSASFADARNMRFEFGVSREQSIAREALADAGDPRLAGIDVGTYSPGAGLKDVRAGASLAYLLTNRSRLVAFAQATRLSDEAAHSPLVRARTSTVVGTAIGYGF